jgi:hypothetical protein
MFCEGSHFISYVDFKRSIIGLLFLLQIQNQAILDVFVDKIKIIQLIQQRVIN